MRGDTNFKGSDSSGLSVNFYSVTLLLLLSSVLFFQLFDYAQILLEASNKEVLYF